MYTSRSNCAKKYDRTRIESHIAYIGLRVSQLKWGKGSPQGNHAGDYAVTAHLRGSEEALNN